MANIKSQIKRIKTNEKAHQRNKAVKSELRTHVRKFREAVESGNVEEATAAPAQDPPNGPGLRRCYRLGPFAAGGVSGPRGWTRSCGWPPRGRSRGWCPPP